MNNKNDKIYIVKGRKVSKFRLILVCITLIAGLTLCGVTLATLTKETGGVTNTFTSGEVEITVTEDFKDNIKKDVIVTNTGTASAFVRVKLVNYWAADAEGKNPIGEPAEAISDTLINTAGGWIIGPNNTYYYKYVLDSGEMTNDLFVEGGYTLKSKTLDSTRYFQVVEVLAEAIQGTDEAAKEGWGVTASSGTITSLTKTE